MTAYSRARKRAREIVCEFGDQTDGALRLQRFSKRQPHGPDWKNFDAKAVVSVDVAEPAVRLEGFEDYANMRMYLGHNGRILDFVELKTARTSIPARKQRDLAAEKLFHRLLDPSGATSEEELRQSLFAAIDRRFGGEAPIAAHVDTGFAVANASQSPGVSVVIATCDRPELLRTCLASLGEQDYDGPLEIVVVDNQPDSGVAGPVVSEFPGVVLVEESRRGVAYARNAGTRAASHEIVAYTDDDVVIPNDWIRCLVEPFERDDVSMVTGNVLPAKLDTNAQFQFEAYGGLGRGFSPRIVDRAWFDSFRGRAVETWQLGGTANMAVRRRVLEDPRVGLQYEPLGPGMPSGVGEDIYLFYKALQQGHRIAYHPRAYVWHEHRSTMAALRRQLYNYSKGFVSYNLVTWLRDGDRRGLRTLLVVLPSYRLRQLARWTKRLIRRRQRFPLSLILAEVAGNLVGPIALCRSLRIARRIGRGEPL